jgi:CubicO group peptidase (beta-lactamase class C family)
VTRLRDVVESAGLQPLGLPGCRDPEEEQGDIANGVLRGGPRAEPESINLDRFEEPAVRAAGVPGAGGVMTAATMARFYQALLHNTAGIWDDAVLTDAKTNIRCRFDDPLMKVPANRSIGLVLAGDDGLHQFRYAMFGRDNSPGAFGHSGAFCQVAWADPATGISFAFLKNGLQTDMFGDALAVLPLSDLAAALD